MLICDNHVLIKIISFFCKAPVAQLDRAPDYGSFMDHFVVVRKFTNTYYKQGKS